MVGGELRVRKNVANISPNTRECVSSDLHETFIVATCNLPGLAFGERIFLCLRE
jgi:hypothetical protein